MKSKSKSKFKTNSNSNSKIIPLIVALNSKGDNGVMYNLSMMIMKIMEPIKSESKTKTKIKSKSKTNSNSKIIPLIVVLNSKGGQWC